MPRIQSNKPNAARFYDNLSDSDIVLFYRMPTTEERFGFQNAAFKFNQGGKMENKTGQTRLKYGTAILQGFKEGCFGTEAGLFSSDPQSPLYKADWKAVVVDLAADIVMELARLVFETSTSNGALGDNEAGATTDPL